jgi:hypothetical protein
MSDGAKIASKTIGNESTNQLKIVNISLFVKEIFGFV